MSSQPLNITRLPYIPPEDDDSRAHFDRHQFVRRAKAVSADSELAFSDIERCHVITRYSRYAAWIPPFAKSEEQLRHVIAQRAWQYGCGGCPSPKKCPPELVNDLPALQRFVDARLRFGVYGTHGQRHNEDVTRIGGYMSFISAIAYRAWSLGLTSPDIAHEMQIKPTTVRQVLSRLRDTARWLGYEVGMSNHRFQGGERARRPIMQRIRHTRLREKEQLISTEDQMAKPARKGPLNAVRAKLLFRELGSVAAVARRMGRSYMGIRLCLLRQGVAIH